MLPRTKVSLVAAAVALLGFCVLASGPCHEFRTLEDGVVGSFVVEVTEIAQAAGGDGTRDDPFDYQEGEVEFTIRASAYDQRGVLMDGEQGRPRYDAQASVLFYPGKQKIGQAQTILFEAGSANATVIGHHLYGRCVIQVVDVRLVPSEPVQGLLRKIPQFQLEGSFALGASRSIYFDQPSLNEVQIDSQLLQSGDVFASSLPDRFVELDCQIDDAGGPFADGHGQLVVTGVFNEGFFVTDVAEKERGYNHLYVYNYSYPEDLELGDRLDRLVGTTTEFSGGTQISFPDWKVAQDNTGDSEAYRVDLDAVVPATLITTSICKQGGTSNQHLCGYSSKNWTLESLESSRVRLENVYTPDLFVDCDHNADGQIPFAGFDQVCDFDCSDGECDLDCFESSCRDACLLHNGDNTNENAIVVKTAIAKPEVLQKVAAQTCTGDEQCVSGTCGEDGVCRIICPWEESIQNISANCVQIRVLNDVICSEESTLRLYGQWVVALDNGQGPLINVLSRESLVEFDPTDHQNLGLSIPFLQGNLRHVRAARPRWIMLVGKHESDVPQELRP